MIVFNNSKENTIINVLINNAIKQKKKMNNIQ